MIISGKILTINGPKDVKDIRKTDWIIAGTFPSRIIDIKTVPVFSYISFNTVPDLKIGENTKINTLYGFASVKDGEEATLIRPYTSPIVAKAKAYQSKKELIGYIFTLRDGDHTIVLENCEVECNA